MEGKEGLQEEFFHTFNTCTRPTARSCCRPIDLPTPSRPSRIVSAVASRWGSSPTSSPRTSRPASPSSARRPSASHAHPARCPRVHRHPHHDNIRELEGALTRVAAYASLNNEQLSAELAERVLVDLIGDTQPRVITPQLILDATSKMFGYPIEEIVGKSRRRPLVTARQVAMYVFRELTDLSFPAIAREFGGRDHTTVIHAVEKISALMKERRQIYDQVTELMHTIRGGE
jgi:chromosomal replication initiator protein